MHSITIEAGPLPVSLAEARDWLRLAVDAAAMPDALKQGMLRLIQHLYAARDGGVESAVPSIVTALWTPWRRVRLAVPGAAA